MIEISFLSSRKEYWEGAVCLVGYGHSVQKDPDKILTVIAESISQQPDSEHTLDFLNYCQGFVTVPLETIPATVNIISHVMGAMGISRPIYQMSLYELCSTLYPNDREKFEQCMSSKRNL
jgi:hypothetical protein